MFAGSTMDQCDSRESGGLFTFLHSYFGNGPVNDPEPRVPSVETAERFSTSSVESVGSEGRRDLKQCEDDPNPPVDVSAAIRSFMGTWELGKLKISSGAEEDSFVPATEEGAHQDEEDEEDVLSASFRSKFIHIFPLYQDYCVQALRVDLHRLNTKTSVSELITPQYLQAVQSRLRPSCSPSPRRSSPEAASPPPPPINVTPCTLWQELEEVRAAGLLSSLTPREIRRQETMFELIGSEASYLRSLGVAVDHFYASKALKRALSQMEHHVLFSNIRRVKAASERFLMDLESRLGESVLMTQVGDIVLEHCPVFKTLYVPYVTNMMYQEALVSQLLQQNRDFVFALKKLERDPVCQRQSLKSFLVLPFQRITRLKLILETILNLTEHDCCSVLNLEKARVAVHEIVTECDNGVKKMKQIEELVCLETLLDFGKMKAVPLVISGRYLVHQGAMRQLSVESSTSNSRPSFISVHLHLFNDLLIISSKKDQRFIVDDHAGFPTHVHVEPLKTEFLGLPPESFLLRLSRSRTGHPTAMILVAHTRSDKEVWMKVLSPTQEHVVPS